MKFGQLLSVVIIAGLVGVGSNIGYTYLTAERPNADQVKFKEFLDSNWRMVSKRVLSLLLCSEIIVTTIRSQATLKKIMNQAKNTMNTY